MKQDIILPERYSPYDILQICGNKLINVKIPLLLGDVPLLLVGKNTIPKVWLSAKVLPRSDEWTYIVEENRSFNPAVYVDENVEARTVYVKASNIIIITIVEHSATEAVIDLLDLRPIGLNVYGDSAGLWLATNKFSGNSVMNSNVAFALGK